MLGVCCVAAQRYLRGTGEEGEMQSWSFNGMLVLMRGLIYAERTTRIIPQDAKRHTELGFNLRAVALSPHPVIPISNGHSTVLQ